MLLRQPKDNGTCAACGGWLPGEREKGPDLANLWGGGTVDKNSDAYQFARCRTCNHKRIDHVIDGGCLTRSCACMFFAEGEKVN
jgi:hypothetical protein